MARVAVRARLHGDVVDGTGARRPLRLQGRGQPRVAPRGQRQRGAGVGAVILIHAKGQQNRVRLHAVGLGRLPGPRARRRHRALQRPLPGPRPRRKRALRGPSRAGRLGLAAMGGCRTAATTTSSAQRRGSPSTSRTPALRRATPPACANRTGRATSAGRSPRPLQPPIQ